jgi:hypothetical protein
MKKLIYGTLFLAFVGIGVIGCKKEVIQNPIPQEVKTNSEFNIS